MAYDCPLCERAVTNAKVLIICQNEKRAVPARDGGGFKCGGKLGCGTGYTETIDEYGNVTYSINAHGQGCQADSLLSAFGLVDEAMREAVRVTGILP